MTMETIWLAAILGAPLAAALLLSILRRHCVDKAGWIAGLSAGCSLVGVFGLLPALRRGDVIALGANWIPAASIRLALHVDWLTFPFLVTEAAVTLVAVVYTWGYHHPDENTPFFYSLLMLFAAGMAGRGRAPGCGGAQVLHLHSSGVIDGAGGVAGTL